MQTNIEIHSLTHVDLEELSALYNLSYQNYYVSINLSTEQFQGKLKMEDINLDYSVGASIDGKLVGFLLYGIRNYNDVKTAYIGGTGVCPEHRGKKITQQMLDFSFPKLKEQQVKNIFLEVNTKNDFAINAYEACGFEKTRTLNSYKGIPILVVNPLHEIVEFSDLDLITSENFWDIKPTWKNDIQSVKNIIEDCQINGIYEDGILVAYKIINKNNTRIYQFGVHHDYRNRYLASILFSDLKNKEIKMINVDEREISTNDFIQSMGLELYDKQYEMKKEL
ncbi:GNAT family N-acetyltransferase [Empedobacter falsenii]|jgi:ribosomal protein S18 acetylase RimI-like enzyme|uniref:Putative acetyltransferase n=1 Tax=Empedobacter falsenii TaxID=343874 RepID=A0A376GDK4_9FLAO|nr:MULTISPECIES: GNAT family N-acetyltransferase [Empedobacter]MDH1881135.1 GNAT family N-acetyltransferase [Empedobacter sp. GD03797]MDM1040009.1 GNAT family N-acetyltransferase [Empedobacter brevis]MDM1061856.1 GNAT family N-acetyltransferase [Empedobacter falsenii]MDM1133941.1 GNAT family N-acetyltransferase [Empedobacter sp. R750]MDM1298175.1 GNAT family N-acetyltransferase [Empedobacter falsenii]